MGTEGDGGAAGGRDGLADVNDLGLRTLVGVTDHVRSFVHDCCQQTITSFEEGLGESQALSKKLCDCRNLSELSEIHSASCERVLRAGAGQAEYLLRRYNLLIDDLLRLVAPSADRSGR